MANTTVDKMPTLLYVDSAKKDAVVLRQSDMSSLALRFFENGAMGILVTLRVEVQSLHTVGLAVQPYSEASC